MHRQLIALLMVIVLAACGGPAAPQPSGRAAGTDPNAIATATDASATASASPPSRTADPAATRVIESTSAILSPPASTTAEPGGDAPDPGIAIDRWTPGSKLGMGTAYTYDQQSSENTSTVWFAITHGAITEVTYPIVDQANVKALALLVSDGKTFAIRDDDPQHTDVEVKRLDGRTPAYQITATAKNGKFRTFKEVVTDPQQHSLVLRVRLEAAEGYQLYLVYEPRLGQSGKGDVSHIDNTVLFVSDERRKITTALSTQPAPLQLSTGYTNSPSNFIRDLEDYTLDRVYQRTTEPSHVTAGMQLPVDQPVTVVLGLGENESAAQNAMAASLERGFDTVKDGYTAGWTAWLDTLSRPPDADPLYDWSAVVLKAHLDKRNRGAAIASISAPWGQHLLDDKPSERGYRYVWPRDLYHTAMALLKLGDEQAARDILAHMDDKMQADDGTLPQNQFVEGQRRWSGLQLDEVAVPIILAWQLKAQDRYESLVKPAANALIEKGPATQQERWEENGGYSPATLAAQIAGLVCAADMARQAGDSASADAWLATADSWNKQVEAWTYTTTGPLGDGNYFLRITADGNPNAAQRLMIANGGGEHDQREIVDQSFLELVRLGVRSPNAESITSTLPEIDQKIKVGTPNGDVFYRYPFDGYGEKAPGDPYNGRGRPWPLLVGERGVYDVLAGNVDAARQRLTAMQKFANDGGMLPEQVFENTGEGSGSATPLVWAHGEYIALANAISAGAVDDRPQVVVDRYGK